MAGEPPIPNVAEVEETTLEAAVNIQLAPPQPQLQSPQPVPRPPPTPAKVNDGDHMSVLAGHAEYVREIMDIEDELSMIHWALSQHKWVIENWTKPKPSLFAYSHSLVQAFDDDNDDAEDRDAREYYKRIERIRVGRYGKEPSNTFGSGAGYGGRIKHFESPWVSRVEDLQRRTRMVEKSLRRSLSIQLSITGLAAAEDIRTIASAISSLTANLVNLTAASNEVATAAKNTLTQSKKTQTTWPRF